jgi:CRISPR-associated protein Cas1
VRASAAINRSPERKVKQYKLTIDLESRVAAAKQLFEERNTFSTKFSNTEIPRLTKSSQAQSLSELMGIEAAWAKSFYQSLAKNLGITWRGRKGMAERNPLIYLNHLSYHLADIAIFHLGYDRDLGILHGRAKGGGLTYDLADVFKPVLCTVPAMSALRRGEDDPSHLRSAFINDVIRLDVVHEMCCVLEKIFKQEK